MIQVIVPVYNGFELLQRCVNAIRQNTHVDYELMVADDHSPDPHILDYCEQEGIAFIQNGSGVQGFPHNCNWAAAARDSEFICLLNSDTEVRSGWLAAMKEEMVEPSVGIVGAKLIYPMAKGSPWGGTIQHAGVARNANGMPYHIHRRLSPRARCVNILTECNAVTYACVLIRRATWDDLGGLDERYVGGQFEDVDQCWRARERGWRVIYEPRATAYHLEHGAGVEFVLKTEKANSRALIERFGRLPSDEHLFQNDEMKALWQPQRLDQLAAVCHYWRGQHLTWVADRQTAPDNFGHCRRLAAIAFDDLPDVEKDYARAMAKNMLRQQAKILENT